MITMIAIIMLKPSTIPKGQPSAIGPVINESKAATQSTLRRVSSKHSLISEQTDFSGLTLFLLLPNFSYLSCISEASSVMPLVTSEFKP